MTSMVIEEFPVTLAPGRARLATSPAPTGSPTLTITSWRCPQLSYPSIQAGIGLSVVANDFGHTHPIVVKNLATASRVQ